MAILAYTPAARRDAFQILQGIAREAGVASAYEFDRKFESLFDRLMVYPLAYQERPSLGTGVRMAPVWPYVVLYRWDEPCDTVTVLRLLHGRRDITKDFMTLT